MYLLMKPICSKCGHIFDRVTMVPIYDHDTTVNRKKYVMLPELSITPYACPSCGEKIEGVKTQIPVDKMFDYDEIIYNKL